MAENRGKLRILACDSGRHFAKKIIDKLSEKQKNNYLIKSKEDHFANTEVKTVIEESIRGSDVYIIQDVENKVNGYSVNDNVAALKTAVDAAWRSDARHITLVIPTFPYARQDKANEREGITAARFAREVEELGADHVINLDIHNTAIAGFFRKARFENLHSSKNITNYIKDHKETFNLDNMMTVPTDAGGAKRAERYAEILGIDMCFAYKKRDLSTINKVEKIYILGDVKGKDILAPDDIIDTSGTFIKLCAALKEEGANNVYGACSLPEFNGLAIDKITKAYNEGIIKSIIGTDTIYHGEDFVKKNPWFIEVSVASYFAKVIHNMNHYQSLSELLK